MARTAPEGPIPKRHGRPSSGTRSQRVAKVRKNTSRPVGIDHAPLTFHHAGQAMPLVVTSGRWEARRVAMWPGDSPHPAAFGPTALVVVRSAGQNSGEPGHSFQGHHHEPHTPPRRPREPVARRAVPRAADRAGPGQGRPPGKRPGRSAQALRREGRTRRRRRPGRRQEQNPRPRSGRLLRPRGQNADGHRRPVLDRLGVETDHRRGARCCSWTPAR